MSNDQRYFFQGDGAHKGLTKINSMRARDGTNIVAQISYIIYIYIYMLPPHEILRFLQPKCQFLAKNLSIPRGGGTFGAKVGFMSAYCPKVPRKSSISLLARSDIALQSAQPHRPFGDKPPWLEAFRQPVRVFFSPRENTSPRTFCLTQHNQSPFRISYLILVHVLR